MIRAKQNTKPQNVQNNSWEQIANLQARLSPKQEIAAFIALRRTFTLIHRNLMNQCTFLLANMP